MSSPAVGASNSSRMRFGAKPIMNKQRTTLSIETRKVMVVRPAGEMFDFWCEACGATSAMVTPERAAEILKIKPRVIYRQVERGELHFVETDAGELFICCVSLRGETGQSSKALERARASY
jgi:hypothetical protein